MKAAMQSSVLVLLLVALYIVSCDAFGIGGFSHKSLVPSRHSMRLRKDVCSGVAMTLEKGGKPIHSTIISSIMGGLIAGSLLVSPSFDFLHGQTLLSDGGVASAQGATSRKSTRAAPSKDANKDPESILRLTLPINEKNPIREAQSALEMQMDKALREVKAEKWGKISSLNRKATSVISQKSKEILKDVPEDKQSQAAALLDSIEKDLGDLGTVIEQQKNKPIEVKKRAVLDKIGALEQLMVKGFPYDTRASCNWEILLVATRFNWCAITLTVESIRRVPKEFDNLPQLKGRATIEMTLKKATEGKKFDVDGTIYDKITLRLVLDGYSAPVTSGNIADLVGKGFYNGMSIQRSDGFIIQTGDSHPGEESNPVHGYAVNGKERTVPLEVMAEEDAKPTYGITLEDDGRPLSQPRLPFSVYGSLAMARAEENPDSASSQFFFLLFDPELVTAGRNLMDGRYSTFGYVVEGNRLLSNVEVGDVIESMKIISGAENLVMPK